MHGPESLGGFARRMPRAGGMCYFCGVSLMRPTCLRCCCDGVKSDAIPQRLAVPSSTNHPKSFRNMSETGPRYHCGGEEEGIGRINRGVMVLRWVMPLNIPCASPASLLIYIVQ